MFGKILLTTLVILAAILFLRRHRQNERKHESATRGNSTGDNDGAAETGGSGLSDYRFAAYLFLVLMIGSAGYLYYLRQVDDTSLVTVILHRDGAVAPVTYRVYKNQLGERGFTTVDGVRVTVASSERMEVIGL